MLAPLSLQNRRFVLLDSDQVQLALGDVQLVFHNSMVNDVFLCDHFLQQCLTLVVRTCFAQTSTDRLARSFFRLQTERFLACPRFRVIRANLLEDKSHSREAVLIFYLFDWPNLDLGGFKSVEESIIWTVIRILSHVLLISWHRDLSCKIIFVCDFLHLRVSI